MDQVWVVTFYSDERGREPVREWLDLLERTAVAEYGNVRHQVDLLERFGPVLAGPHSKQLRGKIRELRAGPWRVTYFMDAMRRVVLLTSFRKTGRKTPPAEIRAAERAMRDWVSRHK